MKKIVFLCCLIPSVVFGQYNFKSGYVITHELDTMSGLIDTKSLGSLSKSCSFKPSETAEITEYLPGQLVSFNITGEKYFVSKNIGNEDEESFYFLEFLVDGIVDLYVIREGVDNRFFIEKEGEVHELKSEPFETKTDDGKTYVTDGNQYIGAMNYLLSDAPKLRSSIANAEFKHKSLINITTKYHDATCSEYDCIDYSKNTASKFYLTLSGGYNYSSLKYSLVDNSLTSGSVLIGLDFKIKPAFLSHNWGIVLGSYYSQFDFNGFLWVDGDLEHDVVEQYKMQMIYLGVEYEFGIKKLRPFIGLYGMFGNAFDRKRAVQDNFPLSDLGIDRFVDSSHTNIQPYHLGIRLTTGLLYELSNSSAFELKVLGEFRTPSEAINEDFDFQKTYSIMTSIGYRFSL